MRRAVGLGDVAACSRSQTQALFWSLSALHIPQLLVRLNDQAVTDYLARYDLADFATQVRRLLIETLPESGPDQAVIARELNVSKRQLQRELQTRGYSFKQLADEVRRDLAISYLEEKQKSIGEITFMLGYSEPANFGRSFKKWTGTTPGEYRASQ